MKTNEMMVTYEAPIVQVIEVEVEQGYAASDGYGRGGADDFTKA